MNFQSAAHSARWRRWIAPGLALVVLAALGAPTSAEAQISKGRRFSSQGDCTSCHDEPDLVGKRPHKPFDKNDCQGCHRPHGMVGALRLKETSERLCLLCHEGEELGLEAPVLHAPVADGDCESCHSAHGTDQEMLLTSKLEDLCFNCHDRTAFTGKHRHEPLDDGCFSCHEVHGGEYPGLLRQPVTELCAECHDTSGEKFARNHFGYEPGPETCGQCHAAHTSDHDKLLTASSHAPVADGDCGVCHVEPGGAEAFA
ncbi:hypothetical protein DRQ50_08570, partial [bacterium]